MDELLVDFLTETVEALPAIDDALVKWERDPSDRATLDSIFRLVHTVKGGCGFLDLPRLEALAHAAETVLGRVREGGLQPSTSLVTGVLAAIDGIRAIVAAIGDKGVEPAGDDAGLIARLQKIAQGESVEVTEAADEGRELRDRQSIRVPLPLLERLMDTVSELVLTRNQLVQFSRQVSVNDGLAQHFQRLSQCITAMQDGVMRTRMQPIERVWNTLPRLVRRLAVDLGKRIEIEFSGGDVELDRQMLEVVKDPLAHMVRNSADHGIETPARRKAAGKPEVGRIRIEASQQGGQIVVRFSDDGAGLDLMALRARAITNGLMSEAAALRLSNADAAKLIFHPGLSTAEKITAISGRGVGMDVVRANLEKIGGSVEVETFPGRGIAFTLRIPLTLAIVPALVTEAGGERFAIPQIGVLELVEVGGDGLQIEYLHDAAVLRLRGSLLPLVDLAVALEMDSRTSDRPRYVIVAQAAGFRYGLIVDELFDTEEIVVKPVAPLLAGLVAYCGNAVLGDGRAAMILDLGGIAILAGLEAGLVDDETPDLEVATRSLLLFSVGQEPMAVPLADVERIEELPQAAIERVGGQALVQYRGRLLQIVALDGLPPQPAARQSVLVLVQGGQSIGLAVDEVADAVDENVEIVPNGRALRAGNAVIGGRIVEVIDAEAYVQFAASKPVDARLERAA